jgi:hypothetical protein
MQNNQTPPERGNEAHRLMSVKVATLQATQTQKRQAPQEKHRGKGARGKEAQKGDKRTAKASWENCLYDSAPKWPCVDRGPLNSFPTHRCITPADSQALLCDDDEEGYISTGEENNTSEDAGHCGFLRNDLHRRDGADLQDREEAWVAKKQQKVSKRKGIL